MDTSTGLLIGLVLVGLVALAYYGGMLSSVGGPAESELPAVPAMPWAAPAAAKFAGRPAASMVAPMTRNEANRIKINRKDVFGPAVASMNADQAKRGAMSTTEFVGSDAPEGYASTLCSGNKWHESLVDNLGSATKNHHQAYVKDLKNSRRGTGGSTGQVSTSPAYGMEYSQSMGNIVGMWPLLRGVKSLEGQHSSGQAQIDSETHNWGEDQMPRMIGRRQYPGVDTCNPTNVSPQAVDWSRNLALGN